jgi:hypothetical protein
MPIAGARAETASCRDVSPPVVRAERVPDEVRPDASRSIAELDRLPRQSAVPGYDHFDRTLAISFADVTSNIGVTSLGPPTAGGGCARPAEITLRLGWTGRVVHIAREAQADSCVVDELLTHQIRHVHIDDLAMDGLVTALPDNLRQALAKVEQVSAPTQAEAEARYAERLGELVERGMKQFIAYRQQLHAQLDTPEELQRLRASCDGKLQRLGSKSPP